MPGNLSVINKTFVRCPLALQLAMLKGTFCLAICLCVGINSSVQSLAAKLSILLWWVGGPANSCFPATCLISVTCVFGPPVCPLTVSCLLSLLWVCLAVSSVSSLLFTYPTCWVCVMQKYTETVRHLRAVPNMQVWAENTTTYIQYYLSWYCEPVGRQVPIQQTQSNISIYLK